MIFEPKKFGGQDLQPVLGKTLRRVIAFLLFVAPALVLPRWWCGREASRFRTMTPAAIEELGEEVSAWIDRGISDSDFPTGHWQFDGEWQYVTYQMAGLGFGQMIRNRPEWAGRYLPRLERCIEVLSSAPARAYDTRSWGGEDALDSLDASDGHVAALGYLNLVLGVYRQIATAPKFIDLHDRITSTLVRRFETHEIRLLQTYPGETYPADNAAAIGSIGLFDAVTGSDHGKLLDSIEERFRKYYTHQPSGLLFQSVDSKTGGPAGKPRGSGTAIAAYFLSFGRTRLSKDLFHAIRRSASASFLGFGFVMEYPAGIPGDWGDVDSGPVIFGTSMSGTGFFIASTRLNKDDAFFDDLWRTSELLGYPLVAGGRRGYGLGGPLGNAIMLAMVTAEPRP